MNISGRGDKDVDTAAKWFGYLPPTAPTPKEPRSERPCTNVCPRSSRPAVPRSVPRSSATPPVGYPTVEKSIEAVTALVEGGCDLVEVGIPYSDPVMDGTTIQDAANATSPAVCTCGTCSRP